MTDWARAGAFPPAPPVSAEDPGQLTGRGPANRSGEGNSRATMPVSALRAEAAAGYIPSEPGGLDTSLFNGLPFGSSAPPEPARVDTSASPPPPDPVVPPHAVRGTVRMQSGPQFVPNPKPVEFPNVAPIEPDGHSPWAREAGRTLSTPVPIPSPLPSTPTIANTAIAPSARSVSGARVGTTVVLVLALVVALGSVGYLAFRRLESASSRGPGRPSAIIGVSPTSEPADSGHTSAPELPASTRPRAIVIPTSQPGQPERPKSSATVPPTTAPTPVAPTPFQPEEI